MDLFEPVFDIREGGRTVDSIGEYDDEGSFVERSRKVLEFLLPRSIPNLKLDLEFLNLYGFDLEVDSDSG